MPDLPQSAPDLIAFFFERDRMLLVLFLGPLVALGMYAAHRWVEFDRFLTDHPEVKRNFSAWQKRNVCPKHGVHVIPRHSCPVAGCGWKPTERKP